MPIEFTFGSVVLAIAPILMIGLIVYATHKRGHSWKASPATWTLALCQAIGIAYLLMATVNWIMGV